MIGFLGRLVYNFCTCLFCRQPPKSQAEEGFRYSFHSVNLRGVFLPGRSANFRSSLQAVHWSLLLYSSVPSLSIWADRLERFVCWFHSVFQRKREVLRPETWIHEKPRLTWLLSLERKRLSSHCLISSPTSHLFQVQRQEENESLVFVVVVVVVVGFFLKLIAVDMTSVLWEIKKSWRLEFRQWLLLPVFSVRGMGLQQGDGERRLMYGVYISIWQMWMILSNSVSLAEKSRW